MKPNTASWDQPRSQSGSMISMVSRPQPGNGTKINNPNMKAHISQPVRSCTTDVINGVSCNK